MTHECFVVNINRIQREFKGTFGQSRLEMIKKRFIPVDDGEWIKICDSIIAYERSLPTLKEFEKYGLETLLSRKKHTYSFGEIQPKEIAKCWDCGDSGFIRLTRKQVFEAWARWATASAPCHCPRGIELIEMGKRTKSSHDFGIQFSELWLNSYEINPAYGEEAS